MKKTSTITILIFVLCASIDAYANELENMEELSFRSSSANILVCGQMAYDFGDDNKTNQIAKHQLNLIIKRVCKSKVSEFISCIHTSGAKGWDAISSACNSLFSKTSKAEVLECRNTSDNYMKNYLMPIVTKRLKAFDAMANLSGEDRATAAKAYYAENCPY